MDAQRSVGAGSSGEEGDDGEKDEAGLGAEDTPEGVGWSEPSEPRKLIPQVGPPEAVSCSDTKLNRRALEAAASSSSLAFVPHASHILCLALDQPDRDGER